VPDGAPVVTYSVGKIRQYYKITLPKTTYPIAGTLTIGTAKEGGQTRELAVTSVPVYNGTIHKPVLVNGKYWAPVNVGASSTTYSANLAGCGYYFQWGRSYTEFDTYESSGDTWPGPLSVADAEIYADKFITISQSPNDWLSEPNDNLWNEGDSQGPCPVGWRVPASDELSGLGTGTFAYNRLAITGANSAILYLPTTGGRSNGGTWSSQSTFGNYWSSTVDATSAKYLYFNNGTPNMGVTNRAAGFCVRCIQK
ncbi:MAG: hypothetical protein LBR26_17100, partial [Prevotella sp.]|nr:hypothetical protein [Prevotella sp.]